MNTKVYGKISQRILLTSAITQILGNGWRMRTTTPAVDTRPSFFPFRPIRRASVVANILREKFGPGDEASTGFDTSIRMWYGVWSMWYGICGVGYQLCGMGVLVYRL